MLKGGVDRAVTELAYYLLRVRAAYRCSEIWQPATYSPLCRLDAREDIVFSVPVTLAAPLAAISLRLDQLGYLLMRWPGDDDERAGLMATS